MAPRNRYGMPIVNIFTSCYTILMTDLEQSIVINQPVAAVFRLYENCSGWPTWDSELETCSLPAGLKVGSRGWLKPRGAPQADILISEVTRNRSFTAVGKLPLCRMCFVHELEELGSTTRATHRVVFEGPLSFLFRRLIGRSIQKGLPSTLAGLKKALEGDGDA
jgi:hypothetical protein